MKFKSQLQNAMICEEILSGVVETDMELFVETILTLESELDEALNLADKAKKLKEAGKKFVDDARYVAKNIASDIGGTIARDAKEVAKSHVEIGKAVKSGVGKFADDAKYVAKNIAADIGGTIARDVKEVGKSHLEIATAAKAAVIRLLSKSTDAAKEMWGKVVDGRLSEEQMKVITELAEILKKLTSGKFLSVADSIKVLAAILAGGTSKEVPEYKKYLEQLERLKSIPGLSSITISIKNA